MPSIESPFLREELITWLGFDRVEYTSVNLYIKKKTIILTVIQCLYFHLNQTKFYFTLLCFLLTVRRFFSNFRQLAVAYFRRLRPIYILVHFKVKFTQPHVNATKMFYLGET